MSGSVQDFIRSLTVFRNENLTDEAFSKFMAQEAREYREQAIKECAA